MAELKHKGCGGVISIDIARGFTLRTHSIMITPTEVRLGVLQLDTSPLGDNPSFICGTCSKTFEIEEGLEQITAMCLVCTKQKPVDELYTSYAFPCICEKCKKEISGEGKTKSKMAEYFDISLSSIKFTPIVEILKKPIS